MAERVDERVLARATSNDQNLHGDFVSGGDGREGEGRD
jgi:hypothetical protein